MGDACRSGDDLGAEHRLLELDGWGTPFSSSTAPNLGRCTGTLRVSVSGAAVMRDKPEPVTQWLHRDQEFRDTWMMPILSALHAAAKSGALPEPPKSLGELSLYVSTRFGMLQRLASRIRTGTTDLFKFAQESRGPTHVFSPGKPAYALTHLDQVLLYDLLIDLDAVLFEMNALTDLFRELLVLIHQHIGAPVLKDVGRELKRILSQTGGDTRWFSELDRHRNFFAHNGSPFIAIDVSGDPWDLLIMRRNLKEFNDPKDYLRLSDLHDILLGFATARGVLQEHILLLLRSAGRPRRSLSVTSLYAASRVPSCGTTAV